MMHIPLPASPLRWVAILFPALFVLAAQIKILNYVCGNDPMLYIRAARTIAQPGLYGLEALREALTFVAPGYPLILAAGLALFGDLSPYWLNSIILIATIPLMWRVFRVLMGSERAALFSLLWFWIITFRGHELHAPFLLYPFREVARNFFVYAAYALAIYAVMHKRRTGRCIIAAFISVIVACAIREPSALIIPGFALGILALPAPWFSRRKAFIIFSAPLLAAGLAGWFFARSYNIEAVTQFSVLHYLNNNEVAIHRMKEMMAWFPERMTWIGLLFVVAGGLRALFRAPALFLWFALPGLFMFVFYAHMQMHDRYFLSTIILLAPLAGYGIDGLLQLLERFKFCIFRHRLFRPISTGFIVMALLAGMIDTWNRIQRWGPHADAAQVRYWMDLVGNLESSGSGRVQIAVEQRCRYLEDLLLSYTDANLLDPKAIDSWSSDVYPAHYFKPLNRAALYATPQWLMYLQVFAHRSIADIMNVLPVADDQPMVHEIGTGLYEQMRITPWKSGTHRQSISLPEGNYHVLWFDWGRSDPDAVKQLEVIHASGETVLSSWTMSGRGIQAVCLEGLLSTNQSITLQITSDKPIPSRPLVAVTTGEEFYRFDLGRDRPLSANAFWGGQKRDSVELHPPSLQVGAKRQLLLPALTGCEGRAWEIEIHLNEPRAGEAIRVYSKNGNEYILRDTVLSDGTSIRLHATGDEQLFLDVVQTKNPEAQLSKAVKSIAFRLNKPVAVNRIAE